jgi:hypothetical protein
LRSPAKGFKRSSFGFSRFEATTPPVCTTWATAPATPAATSTGAASATTLEAIDVASRRRAPGSPVATAASVDRSSLAAWDASACTATGTTATATRNATACAPYALAPLSPSSRALRRRLGVASSVGSAMSN